MNPAKEYVVIIPTYNEASNITELLDNLLDENLHILVVDDGSPDGTSKIVENNSFYNQRTFLINRGSKKGYASACLEGFEWSINNKYDFVIQMDADFSHSIKDLKNMLRYSEEYDLVLGSRYIPGGEIIGWGLLRQILSKYANIVARIMTRSKLKDLTTGFRIYDIRLLKNINLKGLESEGYGFLVEILNLIIKKNKNIKEIPITFNDRKLGESKMSFNVILDAMKTTLKIGFINYIKN